MDGRGRAGRHLHLHLHRDEDDMEIRACPFIDQAKEGYNVTMGWPMNALQTKFPEGVWFRQEDVMCGITKVLEGKT